MNPSLDKLMALSRYSTMERVALMQQTAQKLDIILPPVPAGATKAAILIPIVNHKGNPTVILTQRKSHLQNHGGQISFPGGRIENKETAQDCALREAQEEIGLDPNQIQLLGDLGEWPSYSGYLVTPFIGLIEPPLQLSPCPNEVEAIFEVPYQVAFDLSLYQKTYHSTPIPHHYYETMFEDKRIWGFTAGILAILAAIFHEPN